MAIAGVAPYHIVAIVNKSAIMTDAEGLLITAALNQTLPDFCKAWGIPAVTAVYTARSKTATNPLQIIILDDTDVPGALGYHDQKNDIPYSKVFVKTIQKYGGVILNAPNAVFTVASVAAHELWEMLVDLRANIWWMGTDNKMWAAEPGDPVQGNLYRITIKGTSTVVALSDYILPAWADPQAKAGPYNKLNTLTRPFSIARGGYAIKMDMGRVSYVFGDRVPEWRRTLLETSDHAEARGVDVKASTVLPPPPEEFPKKTEYTSEYLGKVPIVRSK